jgi:NADH dehydrogenase
MTKATTGRHAVVIVGGGFGGIEAAWQLAAAPVAITLIDRRNHHLFQPLLYQAATAILPPSDVAWPIRGIFRRQSNLQTLLGAVTAVDRAARTVTMDGRPIPYDTLVLATGARHAYFGHDDWEPFAPGLKTVEDALAIRQRILTAFEAAELETDAADLAAYLTFVIIGGGPTGVELAGTIAELAHKTLARDFRRADLRMVRVILIEAGPRILPAFPGDLADYARDALGRLGAEVRTGAPVTECDAAGVVAGGERIAARTVIWAAGVSASPAARWLDVPADRVGRVLVEPDLTVPGSPEIFVIGDTAAVFDLHGQAVPGIAPAAKQQGDYVAEAIRARLEGRTPPPFRYRHAGSLATIGWHAAVADFGRLKFRGALAWWIWGVVHIYFLIGVRNRIAVALSWLWALLLGDRSARLITSIGRPPPGAMASRSVSDAPLRGADDLR